MGLLSNKVLLTEAGNHVLGHGAGPKELPPSSENQKPLIQFVERGQCPTSLAAPPWWDPGCLPHALGASVRLGRE